MRQHFSRHSSLLQQDIVARSCTIEALLCDMYSPSRYKVCVRDLIANRKQDYSAIRGLL